MYRAGRSIDTSPEGTDTAPVFPASVESPLPELRSFALVVIALITCACAPQGKLRAPSSAPDPFARANSQLNSGNYAAAAAAYLTLAADADVARAVRFRTQAALAFQDAGDFLSADGVISNLEKDQTGGDDLLSVAKACSMLHAGFSEDAYRLAITINATTFTPYQSGRHFRCMAMAALDNQQYDIAAGAWMRTYQYPFPLVESEAIAQQTWRAVSQLPASRLTSLATSARGIESGWYALALGAAQSMGNAEQFSKATIEWTSQYPNHPATPLLDELRARSSAMAELPSKVALLLPFDDQLGSAAVAIRDGFVAAWYLDSANSSRPNLKIYSSAGPDLAAVLEKIHTDEADFIVGPLRKSSVEALLKQEEIGLSVLALNVIDQSTAATPPDFYQFGLTPEDEAVQVARRALSKGKRALILAPETQWGRRVAKSYGAAWSELGGTVVSETFYTEQAESYPQAVKRALNIDLGEARQTGLRSTLGLPLHFEPRRRNDIDVILMAAYADNARQLLPQLKYFRAAEIPVFSTSHVYPGGIGPLRDTDLDGVTFGDMPWLFGSADRESSNLIRRSWRERANSYTRLYALGIDAYRILPYLAKLRYQHNLRVPGVTGDLSVDARGIVHRKMTWLQFIDGMPQHIDYARNE